MRLAFTFLFTAVIFIQDALAQFKLTAEIRPRAEWRNGFKSPLPENAKAAFFIEQRSRLYIEFHNDKIDLMLAPQDVRIWGNTDQAGKTDKALTNFQQAWAAYKFNSEQRFLVGRMELDYDNARILGNLDWAQQGRSHDLLKYEYNGKTSRLHLGAAFNQDNNKPEPNKLTETYYTGLNNYKSFQYAWLHKDFKKIYASLLVLNESRQYAPDTSYYMQTGGFYSQASFLPLVLTAEYYYQLGKNSVGATKRAYMASLSAAIRASEQFKFELGADYLSGDKASTTSNEAFDPLYGTHHKFYGYMDYFYVGNSHGNKGLNDMFLKSSWLRDDWALSLDVHRFAATAGIVDVQGNSKNKYLGTELDLGFSYNLAESVNLKGGYSHLFYTSSMAVLKQVSQQNGQSSWAWLMLTVKPVIFQN